MHDRRTTRSTIPAEAARLFLHAAVDRHALVALTLANEDGLLVAGAVRAEHELDLSWVAAVGCVCAIRGRRGPSLGSLVERVTARVPGVETIVREPSGRIVAYHSVGAEQRASIIDPASGDAVGDYQPSAVQRWVKNLHRKLLLDDAGRVATGLTAASMLVIVISGVMLLARRMGGWTRLLAQVRGNNLQRLHNETARVVLIGLVLSAATGLSMSLATFGVLPEGGGADPFLDARPGAGPPIQPSAMPALRALEVARLRQVKLATPDDPNDVIELESADGAGAVDPATGT